MDSDKKYNTYRTKLYIGTHYKTCKLMKFINIHLTLIVSTYYIGIKYQWRIGNIVIFNKWYYDISL